MPKVLFLTESQGWSGGARQLLHLGDGLRKAGWEVALACPETGDTFRKAVEQGFRTVPFHPKQDYDVFTAYRLAKVIDAERFDIVHAHHPRAHAVGLIAMHLCGTRPAFIVTRRVSFAMHRNPFSKFKYRSARITRFIAVAESIRSILIEGGVAAEKVVTIPSGVELDVFKPRPPDEALPRELGLQAGRPLVGLIANHGPWKGQTVFLKAAGLLKRRGSPAVFALAGRDTDDPKLRALAAAEGLDDGDVRFLGFFKEVPRLLSILSVSVNASTEGEGLSGALRESLAMEIPVIGSDIGGNRELIAEGRTGRLFPIGDAAALAKAIEETISDPSSAKRLAQAGRADVAERYSVERMISSTAALYGTLLGR